MPKRFLSFFLSVILIFPLFAMCILPASFSLFARADEARKDALLLALSENTSESKGEASISGEGYIVKFKDNVPLYELEALLKDHKYSLLPDHLQRTDA